MKSSTIAAVLAASSLATVTNAVPTRRDVSSRRVAFAVIFTSPKDPEVLNFKFALTLGEFLPTMWAEDSTHYMVLEAVGTAAKEYPTAAASILAVEARHEAWINSAAEGHSAWDTGFQTALTLMQVYSLASSFITSLFPLAPYPALTVSPDARPRSTATLTFANPNASSQLFAVFISGIAAPVFIPIQKGNQVVIPRDLLGLVFCVVTAQNGGVLDDSMVAGPAILNFPFDSRGQLKKTNVARSWWNFKMIVSAKEADYWFT
ncbi:hypothetical protein K438DRAFT_1905565 [Mycena galopus ATCC 62051]|nr:hypothetical protein K438DRAFT_1905565 [Mycena galopus ATCC 62051]